MEVLAEIGYQVGVRPMVNCLLYLHWLLPANFGLTIITLALLAQAIFAPLTTLTVHSRKAAAWLTQAAEEFERKRSPVEAPVAPSRAPASPRVFWVDPLGLTTRQKLLEIPVWASLVLATGRLGGSLEGGGGPLAAELYHWLPSAVADLSDSGFLWMDLATPGPILVIPGLVFAARLGAQVMAAIHEGDVRPTVRSLAFWLPPAAFSAAAALLPSGMALYWIVSWTAALGVYAFGNLSYTPPKPFTFNGNSADRAA